MDPIDAVKQLDHAPGADEEVVARQRQLLIQTIEGELATEGKAQAAARRRFDQPATPPGLSTFVTRAAKYLATAAAVAAVVLVAALWPSPNGTRGITAQIDPAVSQELRLIGANSGAQDVDPLGAGQWYMTHENVTFAAKAIETGGTPTPDASGTVSAAITEWSNDTGQSCTLATTAPTQFASGENQAAWEAAGLRDNPQTQPITGCLEASGATAANGLGLGIGAIDAASLTTDPTQLANELTAGTTGMQGLDQIASDEPGVNVGFERAAALLVGPTTGVTPAFRSALYQALALIPGIHDLGNVDTHSVRSGVGFSASWINGVTELVVDPSTGSLLEARNVSGLTAFSVLEHFYIGTPPAEGGEYQVTVQSLYPVAQPSIVPSSSIPFPLNFTG